MTAPRVEDVAVIGSPSTNVQLTLDLLQEATEERLVGALTAFDAVQNGVPLVAVGQVVGLQLRNRWHEDAVFRNLIKRTGEIPPITNRQDTRVADFVVGATFRNVGEGRFEPDVLGMVPPTGTRVYRVDQPLLDRLLAMYRDEIVYLGRAYANQVLYPMWFKHFDRGVGGAGEAYHLGVFGKTGSGKSGLAKMILATYARHPQMGILVIDPQGEFSLELSGTRVGQQGLPLDRIMAHLGRQVQRFKISDLQLDDWGTFEEMLVSLGFFEELTVTHPDSARRAAEIVRNALERAFNLDALSAIPVMEAAFAALLTPQNLQYVFATNAPQQRLQNRIQDIQANRLQQVFDTKWQPVASLFAGGNNRRRVFGIVRDLMGTAGQAGPRPVIAIDLSSRNNQERIWSEELERRLLANLLRVLIQQSGGGLGAQQSANVLVVLDEAHRHAPSGHLEDEYALQLRAQLRRAVRETRKYGVGWFFISQTLGGLDTEVLQQLRILAFGFGLAMGSELDRLKDFAGGDKQGLELYQSFRDPQSFPRRELQEFPFMAVGPLSPLAFSGKPVFFSAFTDWNEFTRTNRLLPP